jgi:serine/threonine-protein kinase
VVSQHPAGGAKVDAQSGVLLNVGRKVETQPAAQAAQESTTTARSKATSPQPKPATTVANSTPPTPATATVPSVVGEDEAAARADIGAAGLRAATVDQDTTDLSEDGIVVDQSPSGGGTARPSSSVTIYVGRYSGG